MREELPPDPVRKGEIPWEWTEHPEHGRIIRLWSRTFGTWSLQRAWTGTLHQALDEGASSAETLERLLTAGHAGGDRARALQRLRLYLFMLRDEGYIELPFHDEPETFPGGLEVQKELGRGGVGVAWLCSTGDGQNVVVKHAWDYFQPIAATDGLVRQEEQVLSRLDHPGIPRLLHTFEHDGLLHIVREYIDGPGLVAAHAEGAIDLRSAAGGLVDLVAHLHARGFLLLDLRPSNFMVRNGKTPALIDVGVCLEYDGTPLKLKRSLGSPGFSAPECRRKRLAMPASDVYGLGRVLFTLVAGRPPLSGWTSGDMAPHVPEGHWRDTLLAMCDEDPAKRPSLDDVRKAFTR